MRRSSMQKELNQTLAGKTAWVTGSSRGIGKTIAEHFAACGAKVAVHGTKPDSPKIFGEGETLAASAASLTERYGNPSIAVHGDLTDYATVQALTSQIEAELGEIDILVNCAGGDIGVKGVAAPGAGKPEVNDAVSVSLEDIRIILDRNLMTCILCCKAVAPGMMERKRGRIINIGSIAALKGIPQAVIYASAKAAVHEYSRCLAAQLRPFDIPVNVIAPGDTITERFLASRETSEERKVHSGTLDRYGWPVEVARAVEFLASEGGSFISGEIIRVDGGSQIWAC
jgi:3-oxoacyl-[acyl-carrier protein] reductase